MYKQIGANVWINEGLSVDELAGAAAADERSELATSARRQIQRLDRAIRSFLVLAAQGSGDGAPEPVDVARLARDVALEALQDARGRVGVDVESATDDPAATSVDAVAGELRAVLQALVVNAVEASPRGERVEVRVGPAAAGRVRVEVADRGPGLAAEVRERLFAPHVSTKPTGSGMGLFLCQRIASSRYGGRVELRDRDGGGTVAVLEVGDRDAAVGEPA